MECEKGLAGQVLGRGSFQPAGHVDIERSRPGQRGSMVSFAQGFHRSHRSRNIVMMQVQTPSVVTRTNKIDQVGLRTFV